VLHNVGVKSNESKSPTCKVAGAVPPAVRSSESPQLDASLEWIRSNPFATNHEVPVKFLDEWICEADRDEDLQLPLAVFMFGYCQRQLVKQHPPSSAKLAVSATEISRLFDLWQMKLGLAELNRKTNMRSAPLPLFDFPDDESVNIWTNA
jgi:hypothetical protein